VAGILNAARAGNVVIANAVGNGIGDDKLVYTYVPTMIQYYLNERPLLPNVSTYRCWLPDERGYVLDHLTSWCSSRWRLAATASCSGRTPHPRAHQRAAQTSSPTRAVGSPSRWCKLSTVPTKVADQLQPATLTCARSR